MRPGAPRGVRPVMRQERRAERRPGNSGPGRAQEGVGLRGLQRDHDGAWQGARRGVERGEDHGRPIGQVLAVVIGLDDRILCTARRREAQLKRGIFEVVEFDRLDLAGRGRKQLGI